MALDYQIDFNRLPELVRRDPESWSGVSCLIAMLREDASREAIESAIAQEIRDYPGMTVAEGKGGRLACLVRGYSPGSVLNVIQSYKFINDIKNEWEQVCALLEAPSPVAAAGAAPVFSRGLSLLIVEDDRMSSQMIAASLRQYGEVTVTGNYRQAIANSMIDRPDIIFLDIHYRDDTNDGFDVMRNLASFDANIFVVMFSGDNDPLTIYKCLAAGAQGFISKPFNANSFAYYVDKLRSQAA
ncbi:MAG TPA: response regulator [Rickettsiales bacterium]|nr:response regulator [Rickettsiales bacterium]